VGVPVRAPPSSAHCVDKAFGWWRIARQWPAQYYAKADDDTVLSPPHLLALLALLPTRAVYAGAVRYTSMNLTTGWAACFAWGSESALSAKRGYCPTSYGPYPFASGPFELLSPDLLRWAVPRLPDAAAPQLPAASPALHPPQPPSPPRVGAWAQLCRFEDRLLGLTISSHPRVRLVNLAHSLGHMNVVGHNGEWLGADSFAAHWVKSADTFAHVLEDLGPAEATVAAVRRTIRKFCATTAARIRRGGKAASGARVAATHCNGTRL